MLFCSPFRYLVQEHNKTTPANLQTSARACLQGEMVTQQAGYTSKWVTLAYPHFFLFLCHVYQTTRVTSWLGRLPYLSARVSLAGKLTLSLVNTLGRVSPPTKVNFLIVSTPIECNQA